HRIHGQIVDANHAWRFWLRLHHLRRDLAPTARSRAEIHHLHAGRQDLVLFVDLDELVGRARAHALRIGAMHVRIVEMPFEPPARRILEPGFLDPGLQLTEPGASLLVFHDALAAAWHRLRRQTPSRAIISLSMPSRRPRSATLSRSDGHCRRIASRIAQPARTRSARSSPMQGLAFRWSKLQP